MVRYTFVLINKNTGESYWASCTSVERAVEAFALNLQLERGIAWPFETKEACKEVLQMRSVRRSMYQVQ